MNTRHKGMFTRATSVLLVLWLTAGLVLVGDWFDASRCQAYRGAAAAGPRGGAAVRGPAGGAAVRGPNGGAAVRGPGGSAAVRGPYGGAAARGPRGAVVAAPRGRVAAPVYPVGGRAVVAVPYPVAPTYYGPTGSGVAAGMALGAMLTVLPAAAIATSSAGKTVYVVDSKCYREVRQGGSTYYEQISCP